jgi:hypothetical protein
MQSPTESRLQLAVRVAHAISRALTWGMTEDERAQTLSESLADWEAMADDGQSRQVLWRALRGIPAAIWIRLNDRKVTAMPAGIALILVGFGGFAAGIQPDAYPAPFRHVVSLTSIGLILVGVNLIRDPRRLVLQHFRLAGLIVAAGCAGLAVRLPTNADWPYATPPPRTQLLDLALQVGFLVIAAGFALLVAASFVSSRSRFVSFAGATIMAGVAVLAATQVSWGILTAPTDLALASAALVSGLAASSFVHVVPRLRHLEVVYPIGTTRNPGKSILGSRGKGTEPH